MKALVQRQIVADRVLPSRACLTVEGEVRADPGVYVAQRHLLGGRTVDGEGDERRVTVGRLSLKAAGTVVRLSAPRDVRRGGGHRSIASQRVMRRRRRLLLKLPSRIIPLSRAR